MTIKTALCIRFEDAPPEIKGVKQMGRVALWSEFYDTPVILADRASCETDESLLQLLPYITLHDHLGRTFCYSRGGSGAEARLHGKLSIGLGGHVDTNVPGGLTLKEHLQQEAARELLEEVGVLAQHPSITFEAFIVDRTNPVGRVHVGLQCAYRLTKETIPLKLEEGQIENGQWLTAEQLNDPSIFNRLEPWSQTIAVTMY